LPKFAEVVDGRHRIVSQPPVIIPLRDLPASYEMTPEQARTRSRSSSGSIRPPGDPIAIAEYLGPDGTVDNAIADFSSRYADQNQRDYDTFVEAIADGRIQALTGI
jgi:hypothetical protein